MSLKKQIKRKKLQKKLYQNSLIHKQIQVNLSEEESSDEESKSESSLNIEHKPQKLQFSHYTPAQLIKKQDELQA